ncbi:hypothetical protein BGX27_010262, partial [Mortierella sp. AM989]
MHLAPFQSNAKKYAKTAILFLAILAVSTSLVSAADPRLVTLNSRQDEVDSPGPSLESTELLSTSETIIGATDSVPAPVSSGSRPADESSKVSLPPVTAAAPISSSTDNTSTPSSNSTTVIGPKTNLVIDSSNSVILDPRKPASRLLLLKPKPNQANPPLFPIGGQIEFEWAFDNTTLVFRPEKLALDVTLNSDPSKVWHIANVSGSATSITWDTASVKDSVLYMGFYTLNVYDAKTGVRGAAMSGHLIPSSDLRFGLFVPGAIIPKTD